MECYQELSTKFSLDPARRRLQNASLTRAVVTLLNRVHDNDDAMPESDRKRVDELLDRIGMRGLLDRVIVPNEDHLSRLLREYVNCYNADRVDTELQDSPMGRPTEHRPTPEAQVVERPRVGGLRHRYERQDAA